MSWAHPSHENVDWPCSFLLPCLCSCSSTAYNSFPLYLHVLKSFSSFTAQSNVTSFTMSFLIFSSGQNFSFHYSFGPLHLLHCIYTELGFVLQVCLLATSALGNSGSLQVGNVHLMHFQNQEQDLPCSMLFV